MYNKFVNNNSRSVKLSITYQQHIHLSFPHLSTSSKLNVRVSLLIVYVVSIAINILVGKPRRSSTTTVFMFVRE